MAKKFVFDFWTLDTKQHFGRETMTEKEAEEYCKKFQLGKDKRENCGCPIGHHQMFEQCRGY